MMSAWSVSISADRLRIRSWRSFGLGLQAGGLLLEVVAQRFEFLLEAFPGDRGGRIDTVLGPLGGAFGPRGLADDPLKARTVVSSWRKTGVGVSMLPESIESRVPAWSLAISAWAWAVASCWRRAVV